MMLFSINLTIIMEAQFKQQELTTLLQTYVQQIALGLMEHTPEKIIEMLETNQHFFSQLSEMGGDAKTQNAPISSEDQPAVAAVEYQEHEPTSELEEILQKQQNLIERIHLIVKEHRPVQISNHSWHHLVVWFHALSWNDKEDMYQHMRAPFWAFLSPTQQAPLYFKNFLKTNHIAMNEKQAFSALSETIRNLQEIDHEVSSLYNTFWNTHAAWKRQQVETQRQLKIEIQEKKRLRTQDWISKLTQAKDNAPHLTSSVEGYIAILNNLTNSQWGGWGEITSMFQRLDFHSIPSEFQEAYQAIEAFGHGHFQTPIQATSQHNE